MKKYTIRELRAFKKYTQQDLSDRTGISTMSLSRYETEEDYLKNVKYGNLKKIAKALDVEVEDIDMDRI